MQQLVTVGPKYQVVIPKIVRNKLGVKPGDKVSIAAKSKTQAEIKVRPKSWTQSSLGIAKEAWKGIDTTKYLEKLRNEWERK